MKRLIAVLVLLSAPAFAQTTCINCPGSAYGATGGATVNIVPKATGTNGQLADSAITDNATNVTITGEGLLFSADNLKDIGAVGATRPRTMYLGTSGIAPLFNASTGFQVAGAAANSNILIGDGTNFVSGTLQKDKQDPAGAITGDTTDKTIYTYTMPANTLASGKCLKILFGFMHTVGSASVTYKISFGATAVTSASATASTAAWTQVTVCNNAGSTTAQWGLAGPMIFGTGVVTPVFSSPAENTASGNIIIKATFNVAATDQVTPKGWLVELVP